MNEEKTAGQTPSDSPGVDSTAGGAPRRCAYTRCGEHLVYDGKGRPPEYCPDRRWPEGKTCKQLAALERDTARAAGLEVPLETFRALADRLTPTAQALAEQLNRVLVAVAEVGDGALARMGQAEQLVEESRGQVSTARQDADAAVRLRVTAEQERDRSQAREREAIAAARQSQSEAEEQVRRAWEVASQADQAKGRAEARAVAAEDARHAEVYRRELAEQRSDSAEAEVGAAREELARLIHREETARREVAHMTVLIDRAASDHAEVQEQVRGLERDLQEFRLQNESLRVSAEKAALSLEVARSQTAVEQARTAAAVQQAQAAQSRLDALVARLSSPRQGEHDREAGDERPSPRKRAAKASGKG